MIQQNTFKRGLAFPYFVENKESTAGLPIEKFEPPELCIPLKQGFGAACGPVVEPGQNIKAGEMVGRPLDEKSVPVHCGISGQVLAVEERPTAAGDCLCVIVRNDGAGIKAPPLPPVQGHTGLPALMRNAGLCGLGGAGFPTFLKYSTDKPIHDILINGCECEPYLTCDQALMLEEPEKILTGAQAFSDAVGGAAVKICVEDNKSDAIRRLRDAARNSGAEIIVLPSRYPQGGERQLIQSVLHTEVPAGGLPADCGVLVSNAATAAAMADALAGLPLTHRIVTVSGQVERPANLWVPVGTPISALLERCGTSLEDIAGRRLIAGGPMTGILLENPDIPITKVTGGILLLDPPSVQEHNCIRCGGCARVCPSRLIPYAIDAAVIAGDMEQCADYHAEQCISCGCCSYICPAKRFLATRVTLARGGVLRRRAAVNASKGG